MRFMVSILSFDVPGIVELSGQKKG